MSQVGVRVRLEKWPYGGILQESATGTIVTEYTRGFEVKWDGLTYPKGHAPEEVVAI